ncbi:MAG: FtsX-like permease family protein [Verrucomicrobiota bacterium]
MVFLAIPLRNLRQRRLRTALTVLGIAVGIGSLVSLVGMSRGADRAFILAALTRETHLIATRKGAVDVLAVSVEEEVGRQIERREEVAEVAGELLGILDVRRDGDGETLHMIVTGWPNDSFLWKSFDLSEGMIPRPRWPEGFEIVLGENWAGALEKSSGDEVELLGYPGTVSGIAISEIVANRQMGFMELSDLQEIVREPGQISTLNIRLKDPGTMESRVALCAELEEEFPELSFYPSEELAAESAALGFLRAFTGANSPVAIVVALIVTVNTLLMSVVERKAEFAIYSALGWAPSRILRLVMIEGVILSVIGGLFGVLIGWAALRWVASLPYLLAIETTFDPVLVAVWALAIIALGIGGSLYPAWRASRTRPIEGIASN